MQGTAQGKNARNASLYVGRRVTVMEQPMKTRRSVGAQGSPSLGSWGNTAQRNTCMLKQSETNCGQNFPKIVRMKADLTDEELKYSLHSSSLSKYLIDT